MSDYALTADEVERIETIICPSHSEVLRVTGMTNVEAAEWVGSHLDCSLTVAFADRPSPVDIARALADYDLNH